MTLQQKANGVAQELVQKGLSTNSIIALLLSGAAISGLNAKYISSLNPDDNYTAGLWGWGKSYAMLDKVRDKSESEAIAYETNELVTDTGHWSGGDYSLNDFLHNKSHKRYEDLLSDFYDFWLQKDKKDKPADIDNMLGYYDNVIPALKVDIYNNTNSNSTADDNAAKEKRTPRNPCQSKAFAKGGSTDNTKFNGSVDIDESLVRPNNDVPAQEAVYDPGQSDNATVQDALGFLIDAVKRKVHFIEYDDGHGGYCNAVPWAVYYRYFGGREAARWLTATIPDGPTELGPRTMVPGNVKVKWGFTDPQPGDFIGFKNYPGLSPAGHWAVLWGIKDGYAYHFDQNYGGLHLASAIVVMKTPVEVMQNWAYYLLTPPWKG